jgi:small GTP-binding protein
MHRLDPPASHLPICPCSAQPICCSPCAICGHLFYRRKLHSLASPFPLSAFSLQKPDKPDKGGRRNSILRTLSKKFDERVVLLGLQGCGKSTLCNQLNYTSPMNLTTSVSNPTKHDGEVMHHQPSPNMRMMIWDMSGAEAARREIWEPQCLLSSAIMFVIDAGEREQLPLAQQELLQILRNPDLSLAVPLLVWVNKMDVEGSVTEAEINESLQLNTVCPHRQWCVQGSVFHDRARGVVSDCSTKQRRLSCPPICPACCPPPLCSSALTAWSVRPHRAEPRAPVAVRGTGAPAQEEVQRLAGPAAVRGATGQHRGAGHTGAAHRVRAGAAAPPPSPPPPSPPPSPPCRPPAACPPACLTWPLILAPAMMPAAYAAAAVLSGYSSSSGSRPVGGGGGCGCHGVRDARALTQLRHGCARTVIELTYSPLLLRESSCSRR